jgi:hypothetical protein
VFCAEIAWRFGLEATFLPGNRNYLRVSTAQKGGAQ